jgi:polysaccharide export outer membrane protein
VRTILKFGWLLILLALNSIVNSQTNSDLDYLELFPENQSNDIASRIPSNNLTREDVPAFENSVKREMPESDGIEIFGLDLFSTSPTTFAPVDFSPAPLDYVLGPGDELLVKYFGNINLQELIRVTREGNILLPQIGSRQISGLTFNEAQERIRSSVEASLIGVEVEISLSKIRSIQVFVLGNALNPGAYTVSSLSNISNVLFFAGGPSDYGSLRNIEVKRNGDSIGFFDFYDLLINGNTKSDIRLQSNDAVLIKPTGISVSIVGEVKKQAKFELLESETFSDLLEFSSGFTQNADKSKITLSRIAENGERIFDNFSFEEAEKIKFTDGDKIRIHSLSNTPRNKILVKGSTTINGSIAFEDGLALEDIIKPSLILETTYTPFVAIERENIFGSKKLLKTNLLSKENKTFLQANDVIYIFSRSDIEFINSILVANALGILDSVDSKKLNDYLSPEFKISVDNTNSTSQMNGSELDANNFIPTRSNKPDNEDLEKYKCKSLQLLSKQSDSSTIKFVKSKQFPKSNFSPVDELKFIEKCPEIFEENPNLLVFSLENSSIISGEVRNPGIFPSYMVSSPLDLLSYAGGQTDSSSGMMDIFTHDGKSFNLDLKEMQNFRKLGIESGFYANISSKIRDEVFSVSLQGSFVSPGVYGVRQGERLSSVIKRAGGYKENAFPYGGILARKSVAEMEKIGFMKSADQLKESVASAISSGRISSSGGNPALVLSSISSLIGDLEKINPIGRVVSEFDIDNLEKYPERDILLESGDRIFVPERSSTVTVSGQVLSPTSFNFNPKFKVNDYIQLAGGYQEGADRNRILVIYPNGMATRVRAWPNQPDISPGTSLIIPRDPNPFDWLVFTNILFPIISNFATSAAAIAALGNNN